MPVTYFSSTGPISFSPVAPRDQAVGPIEVAIAPSPPDETIEPWHNSNHRVSRRSQTMLGVAALTAIAAMMVAGPNS